MRLSMTNRVCAVAILLGLPGLVQAGSTSDIVKIFGRDPGMSAAHACFIRHYTKAHLAGHPRQNVTDMVVYVGKNDDTDQYYSVNMQVNFRQLSKPYQVSGSCEASADGKHTLGCGVECDGGHLDVRVKNEMSLLVEIPDFARIFDPVDLETDERADVPDKAKFGADDKIFRIDRTDLKDCGPVIYDEAVKSKVMQGIITQ
jgi:hypothetical protein